MLTQSLHLLFGLFLAVSPINGKPVEKRQSDVSAACDIGFATQNGGTIGGQGGETVTVSDLDSFSAAVAQDGPLIVILDTSLSGSARVSVTSDKTIVGSENINLSGVTNVIIRNLVFTNVEAVNGDAIHIQETTNVWVDHCELSSERGGGGFDGLIDITVQSDFVTVSHTYMHDHGKASLCGADDADTGDEGKLHVTYANNHFENNISRGPLLRFGTGHIYNSYYDRQSNAINLRIGAQALVQSVVFEECSAAIVSEFEIDGYAVVEDCELNGGSHNAPEGTLTSDGIPYDFILLGSANVKAAVVGEAGATLVF